MPFLSHLRRLGHILCLLGIALLTAPRLPAEDNPPHPPPVQAQPFGDRIELTHRWLFRSGAPPPASPDLTSPTLDETDWQTIDTSRYLFTQGIFLPNQLWYRTHIHLPPGQHDLGLSLANIGGSYRVAVNGHDIGGHGAMSGHGDFLVSPADTFAIPDNLVAGDPLHGADLTVTVHAFVGTIDRISISRQDGISPTSVVFIGPRSLLVRDAHAEFGKGSAELASIVTLWAVLCFLACALSVLIPKVRAYRFLAVFAGGLLLNLVVTRYADSHFFAHTHWIVWPAQLAVVVSGIAALEFCRIVAGSRRNRALDIFEGLLILSAASLYPASVGIFSLYVYTLLMRLAGAGGIAVVLLYVILGVKRRRPDAYILLAAALAYGLYLGVWALFGRVTFANPLLQRFAHAFVDHLAPGSIGDFAVVLGFLAILIVHTLHIIRERASIASEIEAARTMQQLLLARSSEPTPGFTVETSYLPAGEVGGDFFLVAPTHDGALSAIVGDVSGKGMRAAMRVSMILGVLRREPSRDPAIVLCSLNEALLAQSELGFTTACCIRLEPSGRFTVANAGHISPYLAGLGRSQEFQVPPALPLGLAPDQVYETLEGTLLPGQRLILLSDGVPEARAPKGELYGFERLLPLVLKPAADIASAALLFGQEDDITVVTVACVTPTPPPPPPPPSAPPPPRP